MKLHFNRFNSVSIGGFLAKPADFIVEENLSYKFFSRFSRGKSGIEKSKGKYFLFLLEKKNMTTEEAIKIIKKKSDTGYAGLKDKNAVTRQYITTKKKLADFSHNNHGQFSLTFLGKCEYFLSPGDLVSNTFTIALHRIKKKSLERIKELKIMPNYFGLQRFGIKKNNHIIGKYILKRDYTKALRLIDDGKYSSLAEIPKQRIKFFIHAYQSWLFNEALSELIKKKEKKRELPLVGYDTKLTQEEKRMMDKESLAPADFMLSDLSIKCRGGRRKTFIRIGKIDYINRKASVILKFTLPKGSYATVLLNEMGIKTR